MRRALLCLALTVLAAGCGEHRLRGPVTTAAPSGSLVVTADFGRELLRDLRIAPGQSVIAALEGVAAVTTTYGGLYVESIDGRAGSVDAGRDWLFFVNGIEADVGAAQVDVMDGDRIWWDYRAWRDTPAAPVVVGSWPEPFLHGLGGRQPAVSADAPLAQVLRRAGANVVAGPTRLRLLVGSDAALRKRDELWRAAGHDPRGHGLTAWIRGRSVFVWNGEEGRAHVVAAAAAILAATRSGDDVVMALAGTTPAAAAAAAAALARDPSIAARRYAVVFDAIGSPIAYGGTG